MTDKTENNTDVPQLTIEPVMVTEPVNVPITPLPTPPVSIKSTNNPQMDNLIKQAAKRNEELNKQNEKKWANQPTIKLQSNTDKVKQILKDNGMDSQQADKAYILLTSLLD